MNRAIKKAAVIGSGIMGSRIACHLANIGVEVLLLDIVPNESILYAIDYSLDNMISFSKSEPPVSKVQDLDDTDDTNEQHKSPKKGHRQGNLR